MPPPFAVRLIRFGMLKAHVRYKFRYSIPISLDALVRFYGFLHSSFFGRLPVGLPVPLGS